MQLFIFLDPTGDFDVLAGSAEFLMNLGVGVILVEWETECRLSLGFTLGCMVLGDPIG